MEEGKGDSEQARREGVCVGGAGSEGEEGLINRTKTIVLKIGRQRNLDGPRGDHRTAADVRGAPFSLSYVPALHPPSSFTLYSRHFYLNTVPWTFLLSLVSAPPPLPPPLPFLPVTFLPLSIPF